MKKLEQTIKAITSLDAFQCFPKSALKLEQAQEALNIQFQLLNSEFQDNNHLLQNKVAELNLVSDYFKTILDHMSQAILFIDLNGLITMCNNAAETILEIQSKELILSRFSTFFQDDAFGFSMQSALKNTEKASNTIISYLTPQKRHKELEVNTSFAFKYTKNDKNENQGIILMIKDITTMRQLEAAAARADRLKILGEMAAQVVHEIRNPLGGIKGFASLLEQDLNHKPHLKKMAESIIQGTEQLNNLLNQILHYTRPLHLNIEKTDLTALLIEIKELVCADSNLYRPSILIDIEPPSEPILIFIDSLHLKSALLNVVVNAIQAMPKGGRIRFNLWKTPSDVFLSISDEGIGISQEHLSKLFSPFFTTKPEGNGLGLAEVQKVIQAHGGKIDVNSILGQGTTFTITLPY